MVTRIYLIRHGEAFSNVDNILAGVRTDKGLTLRGVAQAERLRDRLAATGEIAAGALIASTLPRAMQTARIIAPALGLDIIPDDDVQEMHVGEADGMTVSEFLAHYGPFKDSRQDPYTPLAPGADSWGSFVSRVGKALHRITDTYDGQSVVIVCHGGVVDASLLIGLGMATVAPALGQFHTHNTSITEWERGLLTRDAHLKRWRLIRYNDDLHARDLDQAERIQWTRVAATHEGGQPAAPLPTEEDE
ncbi:MAG TPA: histidine phosphatase family protein [Ktedonobacterales bacterium]